MISTAVVSGTWTKEAVLACIQQAQQSPAMDAFHRLWYQTPTTWSMQRYRGLPEMKCAFDTQMYHELIMELRPTLIIETGTAWGGSALRFADTLSMAGSVGRVVTVDVERREPTFLDHPQIRRVIGSSVSAEVLAIIQQEVDAARGGAVLVSLDSDHSRTHVEMELETYSRWVTPGSVLVVEDTNLAGHPIAGGEQDGGPYAAVEAFLSRHAEFTRDALCERQLLTMHPGGWLRRLNKETRT